MFVSSPGWMNWTDAGVSHAWWAVASFICATHSWPKEFNVHPWLPSPGGASDFEHCKKYPCLFRVFLGAEGAAPYSCSGSHKIFCSIWRLQRPHSHTGNEFRSGVVHVGAIIVYGYLQHAGAEFRDKHLLCYNIYWIPDCLQLLEARPLLLHVGLSRSLFRRVRGWIDGWLERDCRLSR